MNSRSDEARAALARVLEDPSFVTAPQLSAFLRFVVEAKIAGNEDAIKGYTIAVQALGRSADFDPQIDPIVRVEAARLRRRLEQFYAGRGADEPIVISLPKGTYVPVLTRRPQAPVAPSGRSGRGWRYGLLVIAGAVLGGMFGYGLFDTYVHDAYEFGRRLAFGHPKLVRLHDPVIAVERLVDAGREGPAAQTARAIVRRLRDALAASDDLAVAAEDTAGPPEHPARPDYQLRSLVETQSDGAIRMIVTLIDAADNTVTWTRAFDHIPTTGVDSEGAAHMIRTVVTTLAQPFGVVAAEHRRKQVAAGSGGDGGVECINQAYEYLRSRSLPLQRSARACLEQAVAADPVYSLAQALLALVYLGEYQFGEAGQAGRAATMDRAIATARNALRHKPNSARAQAILGDILLANGQLDDACAASSRAADLNPYNAMLDFHLAACLIFSGRMTEGDAALSRFFAHNPIPPERAYFIAFVADYERGNFVEAPRHAAQMNRSNNPLGFFARALIAAHAGDRARTAEALTHLFELQPGWRGDPEAELARHIPQPAMRARFAERLQAARGVSGM